MGINLNINTNTARGAGPPYPLILKDGNTVAWYDSQLLSTITKDGSDFVSAWNDKLGSGHDLLQAVGTNQPKWFSVNGILFDGVDNFMKTAAFTLIQPEMIYMVFKQVTWISNSRVFDGNLVNSGILRQVVATPQIGVFAGSASTKSSDLALNTYGIARVLFNGASSKFIVNNNIPITGDFGAANLGGFILGSNAGGGVNHSNIQVKEIILRKVADSATDEQNIYNYLSKKYGI